ncbi:hypothetical protein [Xanthocytophaga agilis]|uniref:DUF1579 domain-containing protein n=1 Tax=Xanthocytophaga agilis TaxID=3048010 RepID=A0AAE3R4K2_9BACT|nr:hypothetical protein [Xanthocytophaga agilis]MDJ1501279.1 hypothetical protein [Xanthocytophaga agilis]
MNKQVVSAQQPKINSNAFIEALIFNQPSAELGDAASVYGWLVGSWQVEATDYLPDHSRKTIRGEWHFAWVLEGRAIQDLWIAPRRSERSSSLSHDQNRYGSTIRFYDQADKSWKINWFNPVNGNHTQLVGTKQGNDIVQNGKNAEGNLIRWVFTDIKPDTFRWYGEVSYDKGKTWQLEVEFLAQRQKTEILSK